MDNLTTLEKIGIWFSTLTNVYRTLFIMSIIALIPAFILLISTLIKGYYKYNLFYLLYPVFTLIVLVFFIFYIPYISDVTMKEEAKYEYVVKINNDEYILNKDDFTFHKSLFSNHYNYIEIKTDFLTIKSDNYTIKKREKKCR